jgi:FG-GAP repeat
MKPITCLFFVIAFNQLHIGTLEARTAGSSQAELVYEFFGPTLAANYGLGLATLGDLDGDGFLDFALAGEKNERAIAISGATGYPLWVYNQNLPGVTALSSIVAFAAAGDLNADGFEDLAISSTPSTSFGRVLAVSGKTGKELWHVGSIEPSGQFGRSIARIGDINLDGHEDLLVGESWAKPQGSPVSLVGAVNALSGKDGSLVWRVFGPDDTDPTKTGFRFGVGLGSVGDQDSDGVEDFVVSTTTSAFSPTGRYLPGFAQIRSGTDGLELATLALPPDGFWESRGSCKLPDLDGDGVNDFAVGFDTYLFEVIPPSGGVVGIYRGGSFELLHSLYGQAPGERSGESIIIPGDLNGDGVDDLLVGSNHALVPGSSAAGPPWGYLRAFSGVDFQTPLFVSTAPESTGYMQDFSQYLAPLGDINGDGLAEFVTSMPYWSYMPISGIGRVLVMTSADLSLTAAPPLVSAGLGQAQSIQLDFGTSQANRLYLVLGSFRGIFGGPVIDGLTLPLQLDAYTLLSLSGSGVAQPFVGQLDSLGQASVTANLPNLSAAQEQALYGKPLWHAALVLDPAGFVATISNPAPLTLSP